MESLAGPRTPLGPEPRSEADSVNSFGNKDDVKNFIKQEDEISILHDVKPTDDKLSAAALVIKKK